MLSSLDMANAVAPLYLQYKLFKFTVPVALYDENSILHTFTNIRWLYGVNLQIFADQWQKVSIMQLLVTYVFSLVKESSYFYLVSFTLDFTHEFQMCSTTKCKPYLNK